MEKRKKKTSSKKSKKRKSSHTGNTSAAGAYQVLGVSESATDQDIHQKYLSLLRKTPPETHPEAFQRLREAFEAISTKSRRKKYNLARKFGVTFEETVGEGRRLLSEGKLRLARGQARLAISIDPEDPSGHLLLAEVCDRQGDSEQARQTVEHVLEKSADDNERVRHLMLWASWGETPYDSLNRLKTIANRYPNVGSRMIAGVVFDCHMAMGDKNSAIKSFQDLINVRRKATQNDLAMYMEWLNKLDQSDLGSNVGKVLQRMRNHFSKGFENMLNRLESKSDILGQAQHFENRGEFRKAAVWTQVASLLDPGDRSLMKERLERIDRVKLSDEVSQLTWDPFYSREIRTKIWDEFLRLTGLPPSKIPEFNMGPFSAFKSVLDVKEIEHIERRFPVIYRTFRQVLEAQKITLMNVRKKTSREPKKPPKGSSNVSNQLEWWE